MTRPSPTPPTRPSPVRLPGTARDVAPAPRPGMWRDPLLRRMLALADAGAAIGASASFDLLSGQIGRAAWATLFVPAWLVLAKLFGLYDRDHTSLRHLTVDELPTLFLWALTGAAATSLLLRLTPAGGPDDAEAIRAWLSAGVLAVIGRGVMRFAWRRITPPERAVIVGGGALAEVTRRKLELFPDIHVTLVRPEPIVITDVPRLTTEVVELGIDRVIIATTTIDEDVLGDFVGVCRREHVKVSLVAPLRGSFGTAVRLSRVADLPLIEYNTWDVSRSTLLLKRTLDLAVSSIVLALTAPLWLLIALAIVVDSRGPVFFAQTRVGQRGRPFRMLKFRTMVRDAEQLLGELVPFDQLREPMFKLQRDPRVTRVGRVLRRASLDELPQLLNVLRGNMSLVGPRPEQVELVERYTEDQLFRLAVKPGLTGPMQVYGRGQLRFEERLAVEREYIENLSIGRDVRILAMTAAAVVSGRGAF